MVYGPYHLKAVLPPTPSMVSQGSFLRFGECDYAFLGTCYERNSLHEYIYICVYTYIYIHISICTYTYMYVGVYVHMHTRTCMPVYMYIYVYTHVCT